LDDFTLTDNVINALHAKKRFVESLTNFSRYGDNEDFLTPTKPKEKSQTTSQLTRIKRARKIKSTKKVAQNPKTEIQLTESEYNRILSLLESKQQLSKKETRSIQEQQRMPVWAKLAYASTNPNNRHRSNRDYY
jgi:hypothetical protein